MFKYLNNFFSTQKNQQLEIEKLHLKIEGMQGEIDRLEVLENVVKDLAHTVALVSVAGLESENKFNNLAETVGYLVLSSEMHATVEKMMFTNGDEVN